MPPVAVVLGSKSDAAVMEECLSTLERLGIPYESHVISAHRTPEKAPSSPSPPASAASR